MLAKISPIITAYINSKFHQQEKIYKKDWIKEEIIKKHI